MPPSKLLTRDDLLFLRSVEELSPIFDKVANAKQLIDEARDGMQAFARVMSKKKPKVKSNKVLRATRAKPLEFGVDVPDALSSDDRMVYAELQKAGTEGKKPRELLDALKLTVSRLKRATTTLKKRKLITSTGATNSLTWKVR